MLPTETFTSRLDEPSSGSNTSRYLPRGSPRDCRVRLQLLGGHAGDVAAPLAGARGGSRSPRRRASSAPRPGRSSPRVAERPRSRARRAAEIALNRSRGRRAARPDRPRPPSAALPLATNLRAWVQGRAWRGPRSLRVPPPGPGEHPAPADVLGLEGEELVRGRDRLAARRTAGSPDVAARGRARCGPSARSRSGLRLQRQRTRSKAVRARRLQPVLHSLEHPVGDGSSSSWRSPGTRCGARSGGHPGVRLEERAPSGRGSPARMTTRSSRWVSMAWRRISIASWP